MTNNFNFVSILGRLTADPEISTTASGAKRCNIRVAVDRGYSKPGEEKQADFIPVTAWRESAEFIAKYFNKGNAISIIGSLRSDSYTDKDGNKRTAYNIECEHAAFVPGTKNTVTQQGAFAAAEPQPVVDNVEVDESKLPF